MVACRALDEARKSGGFLIFAYVIMVDHFHLLTNESNSSADVLRYAKGITGRRVIDFLKENNYHESLAKLQHQEWKRKHKYSVWQVEKNVFSIFSEPIFMQKVNYIHMNPVRAGFVERAIDYCWSSARIWHGCPNEDEPLSVDINQIRWRRGRGS
jgi:putative transposase